MTKRMAARGLVALLLMVPVVGARAAESGNAVFDRVVDIVHQRFYAPAALAAFDQAVTATMAEHPDLAAAAAGSPVTRDAIDTVLASLNASHTHRFVQSQLDYYELTDVFRYALRRNMRRLFPPDGEVRYDGIGIATQVIDGKVFVTDVYDGAPAWRAAVKPGDEILSVDGAPFTEIGSFRGKAGKLAELRLRRTADGAPITVNVQVASLQPSETFLKAIDASARVINRDGRKIGVIRLWSYTSGEAVTGILYDQIGEGRLKDVDGLVLDLRGRWGGAPADAAETFVGGSADMRMVGRDGREDFVNERWHKPLVAVIDEGTRSGMEILAYSLKKNGVPLVGAATAGNVLAATGFLLPDDSLLLLAVDNVFVDSKRLEGNPIEPDIAVPFDIRYANGGDPQLDAAIAALSRRLGSAGSD